MNELEQIEAVKKGSAIIQTFDNPSEAVQLAAVRKGGKSIRFIDNPSEAVQLASVGQNGRAIMYIKNPSEKVKRAAIDANALSIEYIKDASGELQLQALKTGASLYHIKHPTWDVILYGVAKSPFYVKGLENLTYKQYVELFIVVPEVIKYLDKPIMITSLARIENFDEPTSVEVQALKFNMTLKDILDYLEETNYKEKVQPIKTLLDL